MPLRPALLAFALLLAVPAGAIEHEEAERVAPNQALFGFGGVFTEDDMGVSALPVYTSYERSVLAGVGYQRFTEERGDLLLGVEAGVAVRAGGRLTGEAWGGVVGRYEGFSPIGEWQVTPAMTFGLSAVTAAQPGRERNQEERYGGDASVLIYLGPEINVSREDSDHELFWRLHHRSGAWGTFGGMKGAMNANVLGLRQKF